MPPPKKKRSLIAEPIDTAMDALRVLREPSARSKYLAEVIWGSETRSQRFFEAQSCPDSL